jgi:hypothetical protein
MYPSDPQNLLQLQLEGEIRELKKKLHELETVWNKEAKNTLGGPSNFTPEGIKYVIRRWKSLYENERLLHSRSRSKLTQAKTQINELNNQLQSQRNK